MGFQPAACRFGRFYKGGIMERCYSKGPKLFRKQVDFV